MLETKASILIVDDRTDKLLALEAVLEDLQQKIFVAHSGREALRHVLNHDFAVILLDVNMPGMDGFETASLIRQRSNSRHTPIIFITAYGDEMHATRGYSLGAVDYILAPVIPDVLRAKVAVFVELFFKTEQIKRQAESLQRRASQLQKLAAASLAINSAVSTDRMLRTIADTARDIVGAHQAILLYLIERRVGHDAKSRAVTSFTDKYAEWRDRPMQLDVIARTIVFQSRPATRMTEAELSQHPDWAIVGSTDIPPIRGGILAAPLTGRDGSTLGLIYLSDRYEGDFTDDDEAVLVQLAQMGSIALENTLYAHERHVNQVKDEFLATLSHELRTPLNAILGWTQLLKIESPTGEIGHGLDVIERNARAQTKLIEDLLDVSRIATGKMQLQLTRSLLGPIIQAAIDAARPSADAKKIALDANLIAGNVEVSMDPDRIQQVIWNLLSNAIKFTPSGGNVSILLTESFQPMQAVKFEIKDTGQGIDPKFIPYVFDRFRQADSSSTRSHGGLGIGLAIVQHIVEQHGGCVSAHSEGVGCGATFTVELPVSRPKAVSVPALAPRWADTESGNGDAGGQIVGLRVLVVDDEPDACEVIAATLRHAGAIVTTADSVAKALDALHEFKPDVLLSDIAMPDQDGYMLVRLIRQRNADDYRDLPAIALTAYARAEDRANALSAGFQAHLVKPINPTEMLNCIAHLSPRPNRSDRLLKSCG